MKEELHLKERSFLGNPSLQQRTIDRTSFSISERKQALQKRGTTPIDEKKESKPCMRQCFMYYPVVLPNENGVEVSYVSYPTGIVIMPGDGKGYLEDVFKYLTGTVNIVPQEIEKRIDILASRYSQVSNGGLIKVVNELQIPGSAISQMKSDELPVSGLMVVKNGDVVVPRTEYGYTATGEFFSRESYYDPQRDHAQNGLSGLVINRYE